LATEPATTTSQPTKYNLLEINILVSILLFFGILVILLFISTSLVYFATIAIPTDNKTLTNVLVASIITLTLGALIGVVTFVTKYMTTEANIRIDLAFNKAEALAIANQSKAELLAIANQQKLVDLIAANHLVTKDLIQEIRVEIAKIPKTQTNEN
jgi:ribosomal protein S13